MRGATPAKDAADYKILISIHAPHAGSDHRPSGRHPGCLISIHAPHAGSDEHFHRPMRSVIEFQSTLPMRGATAPCDIPQSQAGISIHAPHAGSDHTQMVMWAYPYDFNPRSPCGERPGSVCCCPHTQRFQSTLPMRGATLPLTAFRKAFSISIHAPHAGSDTSYWGAVTSMGDFNPRSPCGERRGNYMTITAEDLFQSTLPMRGATVVLMLFVVSFVISIHAPHAGSDGAVFRFRFRFPQFQSTLPMRGATMAVSMSGQLR